MLELLWELSASHFIDMYNATVPLEGDIVKHILYWMKVDMNKDRLEAPI